MNSEVKVFRDSIRNNKIIELIVTDDSRGVRMHIMGITMLNAHCEYIIRAFSIKLRDLDGNLILRKNGAKRLRKKWYDSAFIDRWTYMPIEGKESEFFNDLIGEWL